MTDKTRVVECLNCKKPFFQKNNSHKFCCYRCGNTYWVRNNRKPVARPPKETQPCPICGEQFLKSRKDKRFCSNICRAINGNRRRVKEPPQLQQALCPRCGKLFEKSGEHRRFCSLKCRQRFHSSKWKREKRRKNNQLKGRILEAQND